MPSHESQPQPPSLQEVTLSRTTFEAMEARVVAMSTITSSQFKASARGEAPDPANAGETLPPIENPWSDDGSLSDTEMLAIFEALQYKGVIALQPDEDGVYTITPPAPSRTPPARSEHYAPDPAAHFRHTRSAIHDSAVYRGEQVRWAGKKAGAGIRKLGRIGGKHLNPIVREEHKQAEADQRALGALALEKEKWSSRRKTWLTFEYSPKEEAAYRNASGSKGRRAASGSPRGSQPPVIERLLQQQAETTDQLATITAVLGQIVANQTAQAPTPAPAEQSSSTAPPAGSAKPRHTASSSGKHKVVSGTVVAHPSDPSKQPAAPTPVAVQPSSEANPTTDDTQANRHADTPAAPVNDTVSNAADRSSESAAGESGRDEQREKDRDEGSKKLNALLNDPRAFNRVYQVIKESFDKAYASMAEDDKQGKSRGQLREEHVHRAALAIVQKLYNGQLEDGAAQRIFKEFYKSYRAENKAQK